MLPLNRNETATERQRDPAGHRVRCDRPARCLSLSAPAPGRHHGSRRCRRDRPHPGLRDRARHRSGRCRAAARRFPLRSRHREALPARSVRRRRARPEEGRGDARAVHHDACADRAARCRGRAATRTTSAPSICSRARSPCSSPARRCRPRRRPTSVRPTSRSSTARCCRSRPRWACRTRTSRTTCSRRTTRTRGLALLEFRRRIEAYQHAVIVWQLCRQVWARWMDTAVLAGALQLPDYDRRRRAISGLRLAAAEMGLGRSAEGCARRDRADRCRPQEPHAGAGRARLRRRAGRCARSRPTRRARNLSAWCLARPQWQRHLAKARLPRRMAHRRRTTPLLSPQRRDRNESKPQ